VLARAVEKANQQLTKDGIKPLPGGLTPHSLRRTFASLLFAIGETPPYVMAQMGHATPNLTLAIYARSMDRRDGEPERLKALVEGRNRRLRTLSTRLPSQQDRTEPLDGTLRAKLPITEEDVPNLLVR
jgi:integrase